MATSEPDSDVLTVSCPNQMGILHEITGFLVEHQAAVREPTVR